MAPPQQCWPTPLREDLDFRVTHTPCKSRTVTCKRQRPRTEASWAEFTCSPQTTTTKTSGHHILQSPGHYYTLSTRTPSMHTTIPKLSSSYSRSTDEETEARSYVPRVTGGAQPGTQAVSSADSSDQMDVFSHIFSSLPWGLVGSVYLRAWVTDSPLLGCEGNLSHHLLPPHPQNGAKSRR